MTPVPSRVDEPIVGQAKAQLALSPAHVVHLVEAGELMIRMAVKAEPPTGQSKRGAGELPLQPVRPSH
ncbi:MAG TPA: hypothetical protein VMB83_03350 [Roseiarcus sp.]|nr:hypothetical protein [Roseiarcus sp.]